MELKSFINQLYHEFKFKYVAWRFYSKNNRSEKDWIDFLKEIKKEREIIDDETYRIVAEYNRKRRLRWLRDRKEEIEKIAELYKNQPEKLITKVFYEMYLGCRFEGKDKDSELIKIEKKGNLTILHYVCGNDCPILKYSLKNNMDPLPICKKAYELGAEAFLNELINMFYDGYEVVYTRDYTSLRPRSLFCYEIIMLKRKDEKN
jgi:hypothetical protein